MNNPSGTLAHPLSVSVPPPCTLYLLELELDLDLLLRLVRDLDRDLLRGGERRRMGGLRGLYLGGGEGRPHLGGGPLLGGGLRLIGLTGGRGGNTVAAVTS